MLADHLCMLISLAGCGKQETALITGSGETVSQSSEMAAVTVNDEEISLREWNFYVLYESDAVGERGTGRRRG